MVDRLNPENILKMTKKMCALRARSVDELRVMARIIHKQVRIQQRHIDCLIYN